MNDKNTTEFAGLKWTKKKRAGKVSFRKKKTVTEAEGDEIQRLIGNYKNIDASKISTFKDFPLSRKTMAGLKASGFLKPTEIQKESIGLALRGLDILGAAKTGSGKTLAFLVPLVEILYTKLWSKADGLGALIITPTRELAYQIFEALRKIGTKHDFSAGLVIGGKDLKFEKKRMDQVNIMICTPGRLLQHMDENPVFDCSQLQVLILDEADRCLDMGFESTMNAIIANLPPERQTLLFSATQTKSVKDLARLSLKSPVYVSVHENSQFSTPETLQQSYVVTPLESKIDMLWSFLKHHKKSKILVFLSSCKQVRFILLLFCRMRPGMSLLALYGSLHQLKRMSVYEEFCKKQAVVLFATDIASRGLDFPEVDWVIQLDCPEDATTYIHRVGRTARFNQNGEALMVLLPSEENGMIQELEKKKIPIEKIQVNPSKQMSVRRKFEALLARDVTMKECAQRAFKAYLKFVFLMKNKAVFDVTQLDLPTFARSLGLAVAPRVRFLQKKLSSKVKSKAKDSDDSEDEDNQIIHEVNHKPATTFNFNLDDEAGADLDDLFIGRKETKIDSDVDIGFAEEESERKSEKPKKLKTKANAAKKLLKKNISVNKRVNFDEAGEAVPDIRRDRQSDLAKSYEREGGSGIDIDKAKEILKLEDKFDRQIFRERIREKHREKRLKEKSKRKGNVKEDEATFGSEGESEDVEPNLDWMPDPDKIYGPRGSDEDSDEFFPESERNSGIPAKRQSHVLTHPESENSANEDQSSTFSRKSKKSKFSSESLDKEIMEELALKLLRP